MPLTKKCQGCKARYNPDYMKGSLCKFCSTELHYRIEGIQYYSGPNKTRKSKDEGGVTRVKE